MVTKKAFIIALLVCSVVVFSSISAFAAANWFTASVVSATAATTFQCQLTGTEDGGGRSFTEKTFLLFPDYTESNAGCTLICTEHGVECKSICGSGCWHIPNDLWNIHEK